MSAAGSSAISGASRWLAARAGPATASNCKATARVANAEMMGRCLLCRMSASCREM